MVAHAHFAAVHRDLDHPARGTPLAGVVEQIRDRARDARADAAHAGLFECGFEADLRVAAAHVPDRVGDDLVEPDVLDRQRRLFVAREIDEIGDERRQPLQLADELDEHLLPLGGIGRLTAREQLEIGAQAGEWSAQLVRGVGHELTLLAQRDLECAEHAVEGRREVRDLVAPGHRDPAGQIARARHVVHRLVEAAQGGKDGSADERSQERGQDRRGDREADEREARARERRIDLVERTSDFQRVARAEGHGVDAPMNCRCRHVGPAIGALAVRDGEHLTCHELRGLADLRVRTDDAPGRVDDLREDVGAAGEEDLAAASVPAETVIRTWAAEACRVRGGLERVIERRLDLLLHHQVHQRARGDGRDCDGRGGQDGHAEAEAHGSLST